MKRWDLMSLPSSSEKRMSREPGPDAPRVQRSHGQMPRVLFSSPECRAIVLDLESGETMGDHRVRERAVVQVVTGRVSIESSGETVECDAGTLLTFEPSERHTVHALANARLLLILAPWPAPKHYVDGEKAHDDLPDNALADPVPSTDTAASLKGVKTPIPAWTWGLAAVARSRPDWGLFDFRSSCLLAFTSIEEFTRARK